MEQRHQSFHLRFQDNVLPVAQTLSNLYINDPNGSRNGLFGKLTGKADVKNLTLSNVNITGGDNVGALAGYNNIGKVTNVTVSGGTVKGKDYVGGLIGDNEGTITKGSNATGTVTGLVVGALVGTNVDGTITDSTGAGTVAQLPALLSASVNATGLVSWSHELATGVAYSYLQVRWIEKPAGGSPNWGNSSRHSAGSSGDTSHQIPRSGLTAGKEYLVRVYLGVTDNGTAKQLQADAISFTASGG